MSELINKNDNRATIRWKLLTTASALALTAYAASPARAEDTDRPLLWIELGGQMEQVSGTSAPVMAPFMSITPTPDVYSGVSFLGSQRQARYSFGEEAKIVLQPEDSSWNFAAGIRYGRSNSSRHQHNQIHYPSIPWLDYFGSYVVYTGLATFPASALADVQTQSSESHTVLDFTAGKDVGLGIFGSHGSSTINAGVRFASFKANSSAVASARPTINVQYVHYNKYYGLIHFDLPRGTFHQYTMHAAAQRSFTGIGPSLSWNASAVIAGDADRGELAVDWGVNAALLFGRQKAKVDHTTQAYYQTVGKYKATSYSVTYNVPHHNTRSRSVAVPNVGGFIALTSQYKDAKITLGYRYDTFLKAMDTGIDAAKKSNITFNGPYATISIGLGD